ncbi:hypothetical protein DQ04_00521010 [Trypanosoma grayi]|uniref:hypothetical protein n=1 Tax=Trypanosoma grayi TaxID=71804 RepID=UPI0004F4533E|nr:hypothetical protein DQ04_00521010 [Trypanosoma grayi]KEG14316.1 hypothetical protein DQ04_00521010 [Trypanosoma grayi]
MAGLFQRLMELGEEPSAVRRLSTSSELNSDATKGELVARVAQLQDHLKEQKQKYSDLLADATTLRSEYDAYRRAAERERRQNMEQRLGDKRMLEELRRAGASGKIDETYVTKMESKVADLQARLHEALEEVEKTHKRRLEAEHARVAAETAKKEEVQELCHQFERFKETMRQRNEQLEKQLNENSETAAAATTTVETTTAVTNAVALVAEEKTEPEPNGGTEAGEHTPQDELRAAAANKELLQLQAQLAAALQREKQLRAELVAEQGRYQRQLEDAKWENMEAGKKIAQLKTEIDTWRSKTAQLEDTIETKGEEHALKEKDLRLAIRQKEDTAARLERELQEAKQLAENKREEYGQALMRERETLAKQALMADEAESLTKTANETLQQQQAHYESLLRERDRVFQEQLGVCRAFETALQEEREDKRQQVDCIEDLRRELDQAQRMISELQFMQAQSQRLIELREEEVLSREEERQKLRGLLREEEEAHHCTRQRVMELETIHGETELLSAKNAAVTEEVTNKLAALERECSSARSLMETQQAQLHTKDHTIRQLQVQLDELIAQSAKFAYYREEQAAKARIFEGRIRELEAEKSAALVQRLQVDNTPASVNFSTGPPAAPESSLNNTAVSAFELLYAAPSERVRQQFVSEAVMSARKLRLAASSRIRKLILFSLVCILVVILSASYLTASPSANAVGAAEAAMDSLRQRYTTVSDALQRCQSSLASCRRQ